MASGIYRIVCLINGKCYVGQTINFKNRKYEHLEDLRKGVHSNKHLQAAFNKYGEENFVFEILEVVELPKDFEQNKRTYKGFLCFYEQKWLDYYNSANPEYGYNKAPIAGSNLGWHPSEDAIRKNSEKRKGQKRRPRTPEEKEKISKALKGRPNLALKGRPNLFSRGRPAWNKGKKRSLESRQRQSEAQKGRIAWNKGLTMSEETKKKKSEALRSKPQGPCTDSRKRNIKLGMRGLKLVLIGEWGTLNDAIKNL